MRIQTLALHFSVLCGSIDRTRMDFSLKDCRSFLKLYKVYSQWRYIQNDNSQHCFYLNAFCNLVNTPFVVKVNHMVMMGKSESQLLFINYISKISFTFTFCVWGQYFVIMVYLFTCMRKAMFLPCALSSLQVQQVNLESFDTVFFSLDKLLFRVSVNNSRWVSTSHPGPTSYIQNGRHRGNFSEIKPYIDLDFTSIWSFWVCFCKQWNTLVDGLVGLVSQFIAIPPLYLCWNKGDNV